MTPLSSTQEINHSNWSPTGTFGVDPHFLPGPKKLTCPDEIARPRPHVEAVTICRRPDFHTDVGDIG